MGAFGDRLRREREMRGITLDEIAESTKISRRHLESLEKEDFESLPGGIFNKGFVRAYARFLGINEEQAVADYSANANEAPPPEDQFPLEIHEEPARKKYRRPVPWRLIGMVAALVLVVVGITLWVKKGSQHGVASSVSAAGPVGVGNSSSAPDAKSARTSDASVPASRPAQAPATQASTVNQAPAAPLKQVAAVAAVTSNPPAPVAKPKPPVPDHTFFIIIKAKEDAWISVVADGRRVVHGTLRADKQRFIRAGKQIIVVTGNAGGLEVSYNGKPLGVIGNEAEARTLTFTPTGLAD